MDGVAFCCGDDVEDDDASCYFEGLGRGLILSLCCGVCWALVMSALSSPAAARRAVLQVRHPGPLIAS